MNREQLQEQRTATEQKFEELGKQIQEDEAEQHRLQGEFRLLSSQIEALDNPPVSPEANVIDVDAALATAKTPKVKKPIKEKKHAARPARR